MECGAVCWRDMGHEKRGYTKTAGGYKISSNQSILYCSQENIIHNQQSGCRTIPLDNSPGSCDNDKGTEDK